MDLINEPWPWYIAGPLIGLLVPLLLIIGNKQFGISSTFRHICSMCIPNKKITYLNYDWKKDTWSLFFILGIVLGGIAVSLLIDVNYTQEISQETQANLSELGIESFQGFVPKELFSWEAISNPVYLFLLIIGGFLVGFGTRYAGGCTSGHAIMGLSLLNFGSFVAVIGFFIGGLVMTHFIYPLIF